MTATTPLEVLAEIKAAKKKPEPAKIEQPKAEQKPAWQKDQDEAWSGW